MRSEESVNSLTVSFLISLAVDCSVDVRVEADSGVW
jgi:hypothetical protein